MRITFFSLLGMLLLSGCWRDAREYELDSRSFDSKTMQRIQSDTGIALPTSARGLRFYYKPPIDPAYATKIEIAPSSKEEMIAKLSVIKNDDNLHVSESLGARLSWWIPNDAKVVLKRQTIVGGNYLHVVLTEEGAAVILYIEWWGI